VCDCVCVDAANNKQIKTERMCGRPQERECIQKTVSIVKNIDRHMD